MPATRTRGAFSIPSSAALLSVFVFLTAATSIAVAKTPNPRDDDPARISVTAVAGDVAVTMAGTATDVRPDSTVSLPARVVTGGDGTLGLTQAGTNITVAADTDVEIPAEAVDGNLVARLVQHRGNVFYDVAHRDVGKLRVETPYLVAVIKGTQFNVAVQEDSTTISLFEGRLEIRTPDGSDVIQLNAGEIAIRSRADGAIRVLGMNDERVEAPRAAGRARDNAVAALRADQTPAATVSLGGVAGGTHAGSSTIAANLDLAPRMDQTEDVASGERPTIHIASGLDLAADGGAGLDTGANVDLGVANLGLGVAVDSGGVDAGLSAKVDLGAANVTVGVDAGLDLGAVSLGVNAGASLGGVTADVQLGANLNLGGGAAGVGLDTGLNVGGAVNADVGLGATLDLGGGSASVALDTGLGLGGVTADAGLGAGVNLGSGTIDVGLDAGVGLGGGAGLDLGAGAGVDLSGGTVTVGIGLGGAGIDLGVGTGGGIDLGVDLGATVDVVIPPVAPIAPILAPILPPVLGGGGGGGGLLGGLLGRH